MVKGCVGVTAKSALVDYLGCTKAASPPTRPDVETSSLGPLRLTL